MSLLNRFINRLKHGSKKSVIRSFYKNYIYKDAVCFDIGAHKGEVSSVMLDLGCKVIGFEPLQSCSPWLNKLHRQFPYHYTYEQVAISDRIGQSPFYMCNFEEVSTMSDAFIEKYKKYDYLSWDVEMMVNTITIEHAIKMHGIPHYIKIDAEGYENIILKELKHPVPFIQFEWNELLIDVAFDTIKSLEKIGDYKFNWWAAETYILNEPVFLKADEVIEILKDRQKNILTGEIFAVL